MWERDRGPVTLRARLVAGLVVLMTVGLAIFGVTMYELYSRSQYDQLSSELQASVPLVTRELSRAAGVSLPVGGQGGKPGRWRHRNWLQHRRGTGRSRGGTPTARRRPRRAAGACDTGDLWRTRGQVGESPELRATGQLVEPPASSSRRACFGGHPGAARPRRLDRGRDRVAGLHRRPPEQR